jgi:hypothetical protein
MIYSELVDYVYEKIGPIDPDIFMKMTRLFTFEYIAGCSTMVTPSIQRENPTNKTKYLWGVCKKNATSRDYIKKRDIKEFSTSFKI